MSELKLESQKQKPGKYVRQNGRTNVRTVHIPVPSGSDLTAASGF